MIFNEKSGITAELFARVDDLWERYSIAVGAPTGARSKRKTLTAGLPGKFSAVEEMFSDLDDIIVQFGSTEVGKEFIDAWFNARHAPPRPTRRQAQSPHPTDDPKPRIGHSSNLQKRPAFPPESGAFFVS